MRMAFAMIVSDGLTALAETKQEASTTYRLSRSCALQWASSTLVFGSSPMAAGAVLVAHTLNRNTFLEVGVERYVRGCVTRPLHHVNPAVFETFEGLNVVGSVRELNASRGIVSDRLRLVGSTGVPGGVSTHEAGLHVMD